MAKPVTFTHIVLVIIIGVSIAMWTQATSLKPPFDIYPKLVIAVMGFTAVTCLAQISVVPTENVAASINYPGRFAATIVSIIVYIFAIGMVGYFVSTFVYLTAFFLIRRKTAADPDGVSFPYLLTDIAIAAGATGLIALVFKFALKLVFPEAFLF